MHHHVICPNCHLHFHPWWPESLPHPDQEAWCLLPPGARLAPRGDLGADIGKGGVTYVYGGDLHDVWEGGLLGIGGHHPGGRGEGTGSGGSLSLFSPLRTWAYVWFLPPFLLSLLTEPFCMTLHPGGS